MEECAEDLTGLSLAPNMRASANFQLATFNLQLLLSVDCRVLLVALAVGEHSHLPDIASG